jgi:uncharacterized protein YndB with AHSA1/START domain
VILYKSTVTIARPPEVVFPYLLDPSLRARWSDVPLRQVSDGDLRIGSRLEATFGAGPLKPKAGIELVTIDPGRRLVFQTSGGPIEWEAEYVLRPSGTSTEVQQDGRLQFTNLWRVVELLVGEGIKRDETKEFERLKAVVEAA